MTVTKLGVYSQRGRSAGNEAALQEKKAEMKEYVTRKKDLRD